MAKAKTNEPTLAPPIGQRPLVETLRLARTRKEEASRLRVALHIGGGLAGQSYRFDFEASGGGEVECEMRCDLTKRAGRAKSARLRESQFTSLINRIHTSKVLATAPEPAGFLPDTIVGRLEISDGEQTYQAYFVADPEQAKVQDRPVPPELARAINAIYRLGAEITGLKSVKP